MSKVEVDQITQQSGSTLTVGGGACKTAAIDATTVTIGRSGGTVTLTSGATQSGFGRTGTVDWQTTPKTGNFTAVNGEGYFCNTTSGAITMTMPSGSAGAIVSIQDYNKTFDTNNLTITPASGEKINGGSADGTLIISTEGQGLTFVYVDSTVGWKTVHENEFTSGGALNLVATGGTVTESGDFKIHSFTGPGTFTVSQVSSTAADNTVSYMVVAGGGGGSGGASGDGGGGGGAGGFREYRAPVSGCYAVSPLNGNPGGTAITVTAQAYPIAVGAGGTGTAVFRTVGGSGAVSTFSTVTSAGGGGGGANTTCAVAGGSGGGGGGGGGGPTSCSPTSGPMFPGGAGNTPPTTPSQGNPGGKGGAMGGTGDQRGAGGGGATATGQNSQGPQNGGAGGAGATSSITGSPVTRAGGGGGMSSPSAPTPSAAAGGSGGGGAGGVCGAAAGAGTTNTGGGGGGAGGGGPPDSGGNGGSGIVVIRYKFQ
jgi:hypothetical protein